MVVGLINLADYKKVLSVTEAKDDGKHECKEIKEGECLFYAVRENPLLLEIENKESDPASHSACDVDGRVMRRKIVIDWAYLDGTTVPLDKVPESWRVKDDEV